jgi:hypothetical protein
VPWTAASVAEKITAPDAGLRFLAGLAKESVRARRRHDHGGVVFRDGVAVGPASRAEGKLRDICWTRESGPWWACRRWFMAR